MAKKTKKATETEVETGEGATEPQDLTGVHRLDGESGVSVVLEVDPKVLQDGFNSRIKVEANRDATDLERAYSIYKNGQKVPCIVRRLAGGSLELVAGEGRKRSVELIRKGFEYETGKDKSETVHDPDFKLRVAVDDKLTDDKAAFIASIVENQSRSEVSPLNLALQQKVLRDDFKLGETAIAKIYGYNNTNAINRLKKLLDYSKEVQQQVHDGRLSLDAALKVAKLPEEQQAAVLTATNRVTAAQIGELVAANIEAAAKVGKADKEDGGEESSAGGSGESEGGEGEDAGWKPEPRNAAALSKFIRGELLVADEGEEVNPRVKALATATLKFLEGTITAKTYHKKWGEVFGE